jgi:hypothetical protein
MITQPETVQVLHEVYRRFESIIELAKRSNPHPSSFTADAKTQGIEFCEKQLVRIITDIIEDKAVCPVCGANYQAWKETFGEEHYCAPVVPSALKETVRA